VPIVATSPAMRHSPSIWRRAPIDCAASSMTGIPRAAAAISSTGAIWPNRSTGITAFVFGPTAAATAAGAMLNVAGLDVDEHRGWRRRCGSCRASRRT
jgi:hypothetical protein